MADKTYTKDQLKQMQDLEALERATTTRSCSASS